MIAIGGNALVPPGERGTVAEEQAHARVVARDLAWMLLDGWSLAVTHGNGPQVGIILRRSDLTADLDPSLPRLPLSYCVAETQGGIGHVLATALRNELRSRGLPDRVVTLMTHTVVRSDDPAFGRPTKPIGPFYSFDEAERLRTRGWEVVEDAGRGYRRVVPSPIPVRIVEQAAVSALLLSGFTVIAAGGGGIAVVEHSGGLEAIDAVIDKDRASAILATNLVADLLVLCTSVPEVAIDFGKPTQRPLPILSVDDAAIYLDAGQFPPGSMGPKIEAAIAFVRSGGREVLITSLEHLRDALEGRTGTRIVAMTGAATV